MPSLVRLGAEAESSPQRDHLAIKWIALVGVGGMVGTALRLGVSSITPGVGPLPTDVILVNLSGAFILGWLLESIAARGPETRVGRCIRLGIGTGVLGGYTTYGAFAVGADGLIDADDIVVGLIVALPTVVAGVALAWLGSRLAHVSSPRSGRR